MSSYPTEVTPESLHAALSRLAAVDPELAAGAERVFDDIRNVNPSRALTQFHLQLYCWRYLPEHVPDRAQCWRDLEALADLLETLGYPRYARLAISPESRKVLAESDPEEARILAEDLIDASGVEPPDTDDICWGHGPSYRPEDLLTQVECALALEHAIVSGTVDPTTPDFPDRSREIVTSVLRGRDGAFLRAVGGARFASWTARLPPSLRRDALGITEWLPLTALVNPYFEARPLRWLLDEVARAGPDGVSLTAAGYLPPAVVRRGVAALNLHQLRPAAAIRESTVLEIGDVRRVAAELDLTQLDKGRLRLTRHGRRALMSQATLYRTVVRALIPADNDCAAAAMEVACLVGWPEEADPARLLHRIAAGVSDPGRPTARSGNSTARQSARVAVRRLHTFGVLGRSPWPLDLNLSIQNGGSEVMFAALRHRLLRYPSSHPRGVTG